ncbi:hypothetical protein THASP1DRAFT_25634 [Thamnocephalis sphaerospora]|uniref:Protein kinase domain-containing protein n=1 Tax=Thamnocephalis sphaerospora TaxID=78915 RepID=A0A4P9XJL3_9FUNG|nr:hypothetical protein THASP1DRAFT_25634 [Thamnocephalis sphaerospora]|eukprot:RKP05958.1 hypothetical protein THASP1DRAFT_25634 [Thamnocephalis sphaerospora]
MKFALVTLFLAATAIALEYGGDVYASPARRVARNVEPAIFSDLSDVSNLTVTKELPQSNSFAYHARVKYNGKDGMIGCSSRESTKKRMMRVAEHLSNGTNIPGLTFVSDNTFPKVENITVMVEKRHCVLTTWPVSVSLKEYVQDMTPAQKDKKLPAIFVQVISALKYLANMGFLYDTIGPESIMIRSNMASEVPDVVVADLHHIWGNYGVSKTEQCTALQQAYEPENFKNERGYLPPEDYNFSGEVFMEKRISWMLGATIYDSLAGMPPYGFTKTPGGVIPWESGRIWEVMKDLRTSGNNTYPPVKTSNQQLLTLMETLLTCNPQNRTAIKMLELDAVKRLADGSGVKLIPEIIKADPWEMLKSALRIINPFARS